MKAYKKKEKISQKEQGRMDEINKIMEELKKECCSVAQQRIIKKLQNPEIDLKEGCLLKGLPPIPSEPIPCEFEEVAEKVKWLTRSWGSYYYDVDPRVRKLQKELFELTHEEIQKFKKLIFRSFKEIEKADLPSESKDQLKKVLAYEIKVVGPEKAAAVFEGDSDKYLAAKKFRAMIGLDSGYDCHGNPRRGNYPCRSPIH